MQNTSFWAISLLLIFPLFFALDASQSTATTATLAEEESAAVVHVTKLCRLKPMNTLPLHPLCTSDAVVIELTEDCKGYALLEVYCTNLYTGSGDPVIGQSYDLPAGYPPIWASYNDNFGGNVRYTGPHTSFEYIGEHTGINDMPAQLYKAVGVVEHDDNNEASCQASESGYLTSEMYVEVLERTGPNDFQLYDIQFYSGTNDIFSCEVFAETCVNCHGNITPACPNRPLDPVYEFDLCIECDGCGRAPNIGNPDGQLSLSTNANPFSDQVKYRYHLDRSSKVTVEVFDTQGRRVWQQTTQEYSGERIATWDASNLPDGLYYLQIKTEQEIDVVPLTKLTR